MDIISQVQMTDNHPGPPHGTVLSDFCAARDAHTPGYCGVVPDVHVMRNLNLIVQLDPITDHRIIQRTAINRRIGTNFHVIADDDTSNLRDLDPAFVFLGETEAIATNDCTRLYDRSPADSTIVINHDIRINQGIITDGNTIADHTTGINSNVVTHADTYSDDNMFTNAG